MNPVSGVFNEPYIQLTPLSGVAVQTCQYTVLYIIDWNRVHCPSYVALMAGMTTPLSGLSWVRFV